MAMLMRPPSSGIQRSAGVPSRGHQTTWARCTASRRLGAMSAENVELIRSLLPDPEVDIVALFNDDSASGELMQSFAPMLAPGFVSVAHFPGAEPVASHGLRGLRAGWLDWLAPWASYRTE